MCIECYFIMVLTSILNYKDTKYPFMLLLNTSYSFMEDLLNFSPILKIGFPVLF